MEKGQINSIMATKSDVLRIQLYIHAQFPRGKDVVESLLDPFEVSPRLVPTGWGKSEQVSFDYKRNEVLSNIGRDPKQPVVLFLSRSLVVKYSGYSDLGKLSFISFEFDKSTAVKDWPEILSLADRVAAAAKARFGILHIFRPTVVPWVTEKDRLLRWINFCAQPTPVRFRPCGPLGLGMLTYFGYDILDMFGRSLLLKTPAIVRDLDSHGICIDLTTDLWNLGPDALLESWQKAMNHLEPAHTFAEPVFDEDCRTINFEPSPAWRKR